MSWPFTSHQCPHCTYFEALDPPAHDDAGYEMPGLCAHPLIGMELYVSGDPARLGDCELFRRAPAAAGRSTNGSS
jgi:hypothetical protein